MQFCEYAYLWLPFEFVKLQEALHFFSPSTFVIHHTNSTDVTTCLLLIYITVRIAQITIDHWFMCTYKCHGVVSRDNITL